MIIHARTCSSYSIFVWVKSISGFCIRREEVTIEECKIQFRTRSTNRMVREPFVFFKKFHFSGELFKRWITNSLTDKNIDNTSGNLALTPIPINDIIKRFESSNLEKILPIERTTDKHSTFTVNFRDLIWIDLLPLTIHSHYRFPNGLIQSHFLHLSRV